MTCGGNAHQRADASRERQPWGIIACQQGRAEERAIKAFALKIQGRTYAQIGRELGCTRGVAKAAYERERELARRLDELPDDVVTEHILQRLAVCGENLRVATSIRNDETLPAEVRLRSIGSVNRTLDRLAKLLGLDAGSRLLTGVVEAAVNAMTAEQGLEEMIAWSGPGDVMGLLAISQVVMAGFATRGG